MTSFTPDDLKEKWPGVYDLWKFAFNGKGEWVGFYKNQHAIIISKQGVDGIEYPDVEIREMVEFVPAGAGGLWYTLFSRIRKASKNK